MESLSETPWDVLISGTGLPQSLLALALSRSDKKILHIDKNDYYGGAEAALSLQEAEEWVKRVNEEASESTTFSDASITSGPKTQDPSIAGTQLSFSRAYSLSLSPQLIYTQSALIPILVSSKIYRQLEFHAVGSWWICSYPNGDDKQNAGAGGLEPPQKKRKAVLQRLPNGREDLVPDTSIDFRAKMALVKFLNSVAKSDDEPDLEPDADVRPLPDFLEHRFRIPPALHPAIHGLSLSPQPARATPAKSALPRIRRHLRSMGVFGPGFGSVIPKWGGSAEIAQVACRAGAVGGAVYVLGRGIREIRGADREQPPRTAGIQAGQELVHVELSDGEVIRTKWIAGSVEDVPEPLARPTPQMQPQSTRSISIVSSALADLFPAIAEGGPSPAGAVVVVPGEAQAGAVDRDEYPPVYLFIHSADTGECPAGQSVIYASTSLTGLRGYSLIERAVEGLLEGVDEPATPTVLWALRYNQNGPSHLEPSLLQMQSSTSSPSDKLLVFPPPSLDLAFDDDLLERVRSAWRSIMGAEAVDDGFMKFEDRQGVESDDMSDLE